MVMEEEIGLDDDGGEWIGMEEIGRLRDERGGGGGERGRRLIDRPISSPHAYCGT